MNDHGRLHWFAPDELDAAQRALYDVITGGARANGPRAFALTDERGRLNGPFNAMLLSPDVGATLQELRRCPTCDRTCETNPHACGAPTTLVRGIRGFSNDVVNFGATLSGALIAAAALRAASPHS